MDATSAEARGWVCAAPRCSGGESLHGVSVAREGRARGGASGARSEGRLAPRSSPLRGSVRTRTRSLLMLRDPKPLVSKGVRELALDLFRFRARVCVPALRKVATETA